MKKDFLEKPYSQKIFLQYLSEFLPDFKKDIKSANKLKGLTTTDKVSFLGLSDELNLEVFEITHHKSLDARVSLATDGFKIMKQRGIYTALAVYKSLNSDNWRLSLMTTSLSVQKGKVKEKFSNPRRYSFYLGPDAKINTPFQFLLNKGKIKDFDDLKSRFSIEVVNKEFYKQVSQKFTQLVGGTLGKGKNKETYKSILKLPSTKDHSQTSLEFAVRLIGRVIFCWFLREKKSKYGKSLMPSQLLSLAALDKYQDYYHKVLEPIFFEVLNKPEKQRSSEYDNKLFSLIPYLNGGLFTPHNDDFYKKLNGDLQSKYHNTLVIPDEWFKEFFEILETYNFTIDENTTFDEELSIDPEMLGRIFENLLAEINPETGESARKSTGSYYTPRVIVDYMVDESLILYLKQKTQIKENKLRAIISYDLTDDEEHSLNSEEKQKIIGALENLKLLDPACGSGAFPIGALQKMVFVLQQIDPDGQLWFKKQIQSTPPELRRAIEREFKHQNFDYIRKLGIIRKNIYGIDIQPIATEISRLRCFLTLVVDQHIDDKADNRGIQHLPNLEFKFVTANTLLGLPETEERDELIQPELFDNYEKIEELKDVRDQYFSSYGIEREQLKSEFSKLQKDLVYELVHEHGFMSLFKADLTEKLTSWDPFSHQSTPWFNPEWMFGIRDGFDIIIANPPWVFTRKGKFSESDKKYFADNYIGAKGKINLFSLFLYKGFLLNTTNGIMTMIIPNTFLRGTVYETLRRFLLNNGNFISIVDTGADVFGTITASTVVLVIQKSKPTNDISTYEVDDNLRVVTSGTIDREIMLDSESAILNIGISSDELGVKKKIYDKSVPLGNFIEHLISGIQTWKQNKSNFISNNKVNEEYKPLIEGKDIGSYYIEFRNRYIFYNRKVLNVMQDENIFLEPEKIVIQRVSGGIKPIKAALDRNKLYCFNSLNTLICKDVSNRFILAILNSSYANWYYSTFFSNKSNLTVNISATLLKQLPVPMVNKNQEKDFVQLVDSILTEIDSSDYDHNSQKNVLVEKYKKQIDQMVYKLYDLTSEEIAIIEKDSK